MKVTNSKQLSAYLKDARLNMNFSQGKVASKVGIRQDTVSNFELNPDSTKLDTLFKILSALNLELDVKVRNSQLANPPNTAASSESNKAWKEEW